MSEQELVARCSICKERQYDTPDGISCPSGHDGAESVFELEPTNRCLDKNCITHDEWYAKCNELAATKQKLEAAEQAIRESQEQEPIGYWYTDERQAFIGDYKGHTCSEPLYAKPVIIPQSAEQLHIKELREALEWYIAEDDTNGGDEWEDINKYWLDGKRKAESLLAKQPDTRALDKALLEAEYRGLNTASWFEWKRRTDEVEAKLAELNKE